MLAVFLPPYPFRGIKAPYLWVFYRLLSSCKEQILFITGADYLLPPAHWQAQKRWESDPFTMGNLGYELPTEELIKSHQYCLLNEDFFHYLLQCCNHNPIHAFKKMLTECIPSLEKELVECLTGNKNDKIEAILTICNCPSLKQAAQSQSIPVVHIEIGPLRFPTYPNTGYVDFRGVNGNTEAEERYLKVKDHCKVDISLNDLHYYFTQIPLPVVEPDKDIGVVLQVEDDSNLIAYGNGFNNSTLLSYSQAVYPHKSVVVRTHPNSCFRLSEKSHQIDTSPDSLHFVRRCRKILTINSSVGLESLLMNIPTLLLGQSSYEFIAAPQEEHERANKMAFYLFAYLVPFNLLFDPTYLRFRLSRPAEEEIVNYHISVYAKKYDKAIKVDELSLGKLISAWVRHENQIKKQRELTSAENSYQNGEESDDLIQSSSYLTQQSKRGVQVCHTFRRMEPPKKHNIIHTLKHTTCLLRSKIDAQQLLIVQLDQQLNDTHQSLLYLKQSFSWKLTRPLRMLGRVLRGEFNTISVLTRHYFNDSQFDRYFALLKKFWCVFCHFPCAYKGVCRKVNIALKLLLTGHWRELQKKIVRVIKNTADVPMALSNLSSKDVVILTTRHTLYVAHLLEKTLIEVGIKATIIQAYTKGVNQKQLYIVICPQVFSELPPVFVAFQMEQSINPRWFTSEYLAILKRAVAIFDYSLINIEYLLRQGISYQKLFFLPIGSYSSYLTYLADKGFSQPTQPDKPIDVLFYGDASCKRRRNYLNQLGKKFNIYVASEVFGEALVKLIIQAKVVINLHYYENALLETTRLYETLSLGIPIVSEESSDIYHHRLLSGVIDFTPVGDINSMAEKIGCLLADSKLYNKRRSDILAFIRQDKQFDAYLKRYLLANDLIDFATYKNTVDFIPLAETNLPKLCLSLTETPERRQQFLNKPTYGFQIIEGIRHRYGWIGCGMSYKYMLSKLADNSNKMVMICEDDVIFPKDFDTKLTKIIDYLKQSSWDWHIFSGIIAHLNEDTEILKVEEIEGIQYVYINRMTSTVMNIYSHRGIEAINHWDERNVDAQTNTIDRYFESIPNLIVVTTLPYLVGHAEDRISTLWGFKNTEYKDMIIDSQRLLQEKVDAFKLKKVSVE
jgi:glycosyltransferase involved in cell wall biosynthesis